MIRGQSTSIVKDLKAASSNLIDFENLGLSSNQSHLQGIRLFHRLYARILLPVHVYTLSQCFTSWAYWSLRLESRSSRCKRLEIAQQH